MALISTSATFSVRGFGGIGNAGTDNPNLGYDVYIYSASSGTIVSFDIDIADNLIGTHTTSGPNPSLIYTDGRSSFGYSKYGQLRYWSTLNDPGSAWRYGDVIKCSNNAYVLGHFNGGALPRDYISIATINGPSVVMSGRRVTASPTWGVDTQLILDTSDNGYYMLQSNPSFGARVYKFNSTFTTISSYKYITPYDPLYNPTGFDIDYRDGTFVKLSGSVSGLGTSISTYDSGVVKGITSGTVREVLSIQPYGYIVYTNAGSIGIATLDSSINILNNITYTVSGQTLTYTKSYIDPNNNYIYVVYNNGTEDRITKLSISGTPQWTRTLTSSAGGLLKIKKITTNNDGSKYYISTQTTIFEFLADGTITGSGSYTVGGTTYTYSAGTQWVNGSSNLLTLNATTTNWSLLSGTSSAGTNTINLVDSTPAITVSTF